MKNATELGRENERLKKALADSQAQLARADDKLKEAQAQHEAVAAQFRETLKEKNRQVASLEYQIKLLLQRIRGSRQERIDPDQLLLFSLEELQEIAAPGGFTLRFDQDTRPETVLCLLEVIGRCTREGAASC
jgi:DNA repair exonuclease SbcCD ATPase subunit